MFDHFKLTINASVTQLRHEEKVIYVEKHWLVCLDNVSPYQSNIWHAEVMLPHESIEFSAI